MNIFVVNLKRATECAYHICMDLKCKCMKHGQTFPQFYSFIMMIIEGTIKIRPVHFSIQKQFIF